MDAGAGDTGIEQETRLELPPQVEGEYQVYLNGILQTAGTDFEVYGRTLVFPRELVQEVKMSPVQWVLVGIGIGNYRKHDTVDIAYHHNGRNLVVTGLRPLDAG